MKRFKFFLLLACLFAALHTYAQSSADLKRKREKLTQELEELNAELRETVNNKKASIKQLNIIKAQITLREDKITNINSEVRLLDNQINQNTNTVHTLQGQLDELKKEYAAMIVFAYHNQSAYNKLMFVFAAKDFNQAYKRLKYLQQFGSYRERQARSIQGTQQDLHVKITELDRTKNQKSALLEDQEKEKQTLGKQELTQAEIAANLSKQQGELRKQQKDKKSQLARATREMFAAVRREIEEARRKAEAEARARAAALAAAEKVKAEKAAREAAANNRPAPVVKTPAPKPVKTRLTDSEVLTATPEAASLSNDFQGNRGRLPWPVGSGVVIQSFGRYYSEGIQNDNQGIDIRTSAGATVRSVFEGEVKTVADISGSYIVVIQHGKFFTAYNGLHSVSVSKGQKVSTKQAIGTVAVDGATGEAILQFSLLNVNSPVNPKLWLAPQ
ncbi:murein hydrolase activator EnvC family protein [Mucilaginibacter sp.]